MAGRRRGRRRALGAARAVAWSTAAVLVAACSGGEAVVSTSSERPTTVAESAPPSTSATTTATTTTIAATTVVSSTTATSAPTSTTATTAPTTTTSVTTTTAPPPPPPPPPGGLLALDVLGFIPVAKEQPTGYDRDLFGYPADRDGDGCNTRAEVLQRDSLTPAQVDPSRCTVVAGDWYSTYDAVWTTDPGELEIDHVVALKEAWDSGAWAWDEARRHAFANDLSDRRTLAAVTSSSNRSKGDKDPSNWLPPNAEQVCRYVGDWVAIKVRWGLSMDESEYGRIRNLLRGPCAGTVIDPWPEPTAA